MTVPPRSEGELARAIAQHNAKALAACGEGKGLCKVLRDLRKKPCVDCPKKWLILL